MVNIRLKEAIWDVWRWPIALIIISWEKYLALHYKQKKHKRVSLSGVKSCRIKLKTPRVRHLQTKEMCLCKNWKRSNSKKIRCFGSKFYSVQPVEIQIQEQLHHREKATVWCGLWVNGITGTYIFKITVDGDRSMVWFPIYWNSTSVNK